MLFFVLLAVLVVALIAFVWVRQVRHPVQPGRGPDRGAIIEGHHTGWGDEGSGIGGR